MSGTNRYNKVYDTHNLTASQRMYGSLSYHCSQCKLALQELAGAQAELAAHLSNKVQNVVITFMCLHKVLADTKLVFHLQTVQGTPVADALVSALTSQQVMINRYDADLLMSHGCKHACSHGLYTHTTCIRSTNSTCAARAAYTDCYPALKSLKQLSQHFCAFPGSHMKGFDTC